MIGRVRRYDEKGGYGFVRPEGGKSDDEAFLHASEVRKVTDWQPSVGDKILYDVEVGDRGPRAVSIARIA